MFANTLSVTIGADSARVLTRVGEFNGVSTYRLATALELTELVIRSRSANEGKSPSQHLMDVHNAELRHTTYATAVSPERYYVASTTFKTRRQGGDPTRLADVEKAMTSLVSTSLVAGMVQGES